MGAASDENARQGAASDENGLVGGGSLADALATGAATRDGAPTAFAERLADHAHAAGSVVCLGLDPRPEAHALTHPTRFGQDPAAIATGVGNYLVTVLDATHDVVACCKPQAAFFEALGLPGMEALARVLRYARALGLPVILDAKRGDIGSTAEAYARAYLTDGAFAADALTVNPYLGFDTIEPFLQVAETHGRGLFVLVHTSNPGSIDVQEIALADGRHMYQHVAQRLTERAADLPSHAGYTSLGAVAGATHPEALADLRRRLPKSLLLVPGYGAQGGTATDVAWAFDDRGWGAVVNASRSLTYAPATHEARTLDEVAGVVRDATLAMREDLRRALEARP
ncbi:MAG: orotidine-5'-phosphate decarboxylase [Trueperaceae bacterium]